VAQEQRHRNQRRADAGADHRFGTLNFQKKKIASDPCQFN
jgi:hypothetical protein